MLALITNDDGIDSPGLRALAMAASDVGLEVLVVAPAQDISGASASLTAVESDGRLQLTEARLDGMDGVRAFAVQAAPAFIVRTALVGAFGPLPDLVLSGVNRGPNTGRAVLHSGTVGAALTAAALRRRALAVSLDVGSPSRWDTARAAAVPAIRWLVERGDPGVALNLNVPNVAPETLPPLARAHLASFGAVQATIAESGTGWVKLFYEPVRAEVEPGTDAALLAEGRACFTPLLSVCEAADLDTRDLETAPMGVRGAG